MKAECPMLVGEAGSTVAEYSNGGESSSIAVSGDVVGEPRSRSGGSGTL